jgi:glycine betaine transporter
LKFNTSHFTLYRVSLPLTLLIAIAGIVAPEALAEGGQAITATVFEALDWFFLVSVTTFLLLALWIAFSRWGSLRLGPPDAPPDFAFASWISMLFSAGIGSGLLFWGVAEPVTHFAHPPVGLAGTPEAARQALLITNFHWGFHAWGVYGMAALVLAWFGHRKGQKYLAGSPLRAAFSGRWVGPVAWIADLVSVLAVTFGVAGALVLGVRQLQAGLGITSGLPADMSTSMVLLLLTTVAFLISATTSLDKGIKWLSNFNIALALGLMIFLLMAGPTDFLLRGFANSLGDYLSALPSLTLRLYPFEAIGDWVRGWTVTYFVWWIAWAPFVGIFIARISRGRTIREFVLGVVVTPSVLSVLWFAIFGGTGLFEETMGDGEIVRLVDANVTSALFNVFDRLPGAQVLSGVAVVLIFVFLITSADSATFVLGMITSDGSFDPPARRKLLWGLTLSAISAALMLTGSIRTVQTLSILGAIPFTFIMLLQVAALLRSLRAEPMEGDE